MSNALSAINSAIEGIDRALAAGLANPNGPAGSVQLERFRSSLLDMRRTLETGQLPPRRERHRGMGRVIADSWPPENELGNLILIAEQRYLAADACARK